ncbi:MAG: D-alanine--D-alanine ligase family protein [Gammaproteobacteria bacterium]
MRDGTLLILHGICPDRDQPVEDLENLDVAHEIAKTLTLAGHSIRMASADLDLGRLRKMLTDVAPNLVFNLVEGLDGQDRLAAAVPALLEAMAIPYTGNPPHVLALADDKLALKQVLLAAGIPTPARENHRGPFLVKARHQHASLGLDPGALVATLGDAEDLAQQKSSAYRTAFFAEAYIEGREFNLSVIEDPPGEPHVLPPAEIRFIDWPQDTPKIVDHAAKWDPQSSRFAHTIRDFPTEGGPDGNLLEMLTACARRIFTTLGLKGYARIDFRVDADGHPYVIDLNPNPTLDPAAGFAQTAFRAGWDYPGLLRRILECAGGPHAPHPSRQERTFAENRQT